MNTTPITVVVVNYNTREATLACLRSLGTELEPGDRVVVVDNGSDDGSADAFRAEFPDAVVVDAGENLGFARGVNAGVAATTGGGPDLVMLLNPDTLVLPGSVAAFRGFAADHPEYRLYGGRTLRPDGSTDPSSCWGEMTGWSLFCFATGLSSVARGSTLFDPESLGRWGRDTAREVPIVTGCLLLISRADWTALGGMDERFFLYGEDADFSIRARRSGLRPVIVPDAVIVHEVGGSTASSGRKMAMVLAGKVTLLTTHWRPAAARTGRALLLIGTGLRGTLERLRGRHGLWREAWARRAEWRDGYPAARQRIFGIPEAVR
jgi:GT2 family glycosyltransferase